MAQTADGTIYIETKIGSEGFKAGSKELVDAARRLVKSVLGIGRSAQIALQKQVDAFAKQNQLYSQQEKKVESLRNKLKEIESQQVETDAFKNLKEDVDGTKMTMEELESEMEKLMQKQQEWISIGVPEDDAYEKVAKDIEKIDLAMDRLLAKQKRMKSNGTAYVDPKTTQPYMDTSSKLGVEKQKLSQMGERLGTSYDALKNKVDSYRKSTSMLTKAKGGLSKMFSNMITSAKKAASSMSFLSKNTKSAEFSIARMVGMSVLYSAVFRGISMITQGFGDGINALAQYSSRTNASLSSMMSALTQLRNSFVAAFAPILNYVAPAITTLINMISRAINYIGMFIAVLTGQGSYIKASSVQQDYAANIKKTSDASSGAAKNVKRAADATDDLTKATKEANKENADYLSGLDEINRFQTKKDSGSDDSSGGGSGGGGAGGGGGGGAGGLSPGEMFETVPLEGALVDFAKKIKELFNAQDFEGIGGVIAEGLNKAMKVVDNWINNTLRPLGVKWASIVARILNGLVDKFDWVLLGKTIADAVNAAFDIVNTFFTTFEFDDLGAGLSKSLNSLVGTIDASLVGTTIANMINAGIDLAYSLVNPFDWVTLGKKIAEGADAFFSQIKLEKAVVTVAKLFAGITDAILTSIPGVVQSMTDAGVKMMDGLSQGIAENVTNFINQALPMLMKFSEQLRANAGKLVDSGIQLILQLAQGLINGIPTMIATIPTIVSNIAGIINDNAPKLLFAGIKLIIMLAKGLLQAIPTLIANIPEIIFAIVDIFIAYNWMQLGGSIIKFLSNGIKSMKAKAVSASFKVYEGIINALINLPSKLKNFGLTGMKNLASSITSKISVVKSVAVKVLTAIINAIKSLPSKLKSIGTKSMSDMISSINSKISTIKAAATKILTNIVSAVTNLPGKLKSIGSNAVERMKGAFNINWSSVGRGILNGIVSGLSGAAHTLYDKMKSIASNALEAAKKKLGIHSPSRVFRDVIGKMIPAGITLGITKGFPSTLKAIKAQSAKLVNTAQSSVPNVIKYPMKPYLATGKLIPPMANGSIGQAGGLDESTINVLKQLLREATKSKSSAGSTSSSYRFTAQINRRTLFDEMIEEAKLRRTTIGRNPFELA